MWLTVAVRRGVRRDGLSKTRGLLLELKGQAMFEVGWIGERVHGVAGAAFLEAASILTYPGGPRPEDGEKSHVNRRFVANSNEPTPC